MQMCMRTIRAAFLLLAAVAVLRMHAGASESGNVSAASPSPIPSGERGDILFYSDLGPNQIDVSTYPSSQRRNYAVYAQACSRCHGLARSINAPYTSRGWWEFYMTGMRLRGHLSGRPFSREEIKSILDFLEYDSRVRKVGNAAAFEKSTDELKRQFDAYVDRRMSELQNQRQPRLLP